MNVTINGNTINLEWFDDIVSWVRESNVHVPELQRFIGSMSSDEPFGLLHDVITVLRNVELEETEEMIHDLMRLGSFLIEMEDAELIVGSW